ncbi:MAG: hypothetical protein ACC662_03830, partial [Planctomycetota bacterium]
LEGAANPLKDVTPKALGTGGVVLVMQGTGAVGLVAAFVEPEEATEAAKAADLVLGVIEKEIHRTLPPALAESRTTLDGVPATRVVLGKGALRVHVGTAHRDGVTYMVAYAWDTTRHRPPTRFPRRFSFLRAR